MLLRDLAESLCGGHSALPEDPRIRAGEVEHRGRRARQLSHVERGGSAAEDLGRDLVDTSRIRVAVQVGARRRDGADAREELGGHPRDLRDANSDRPCSAEPREAIRRIRDDEGECASDESVARQLRDQLDERIDSRRDERDRLLGRPPLERGQRAHGVFAIRSTREPVHRVGRDDDELARLDRRNDLVDCVHAARAPSTTRSRSARSLVVVTSAYPSASSNEATRGASSAATSSTSAPPSRRTSTAPRTTASVAPVPTSASCGSQSRTSGSSPSISSGSTYGGLETTRSHGPSGRAEKKSHSRK